MRNEDGSVRSKNRRRQSLLTDQLNVVAGHIHDGVGGLLTTVLGVHVLAICLQIQIVQRLWQEGDVVTERSVCPQHVIAVCISMLIIVVFGLHRIDRPTAFDAQRVPIRFQFFRQRLLAQRKRCRASLVSHLFLKLFQNAQPCSCSDVRTWFILLQQLRIDQFDGHLQFVRREELPPLRQLNHALLHGQRVTVCEQYAVKSSSWNILKMQNWSISSLRPHVLWVQHLPGFNKR